MAYEGKYYVLLFACIAINLILCIVIRKVRLSYSSGGLCSGAISKFIKLLQ